MIIFMNFMVGKYPIILFMFELTLDRWNEEDRLATCSGLRVV